MVKGATIFRICMYRLVIVWLIYKEFVERNGKYLVFTFIQVKNTPTITKRILKWKSGRDLIKIMITILNLRVSSF